jgi:hypothetical protein
MDERNVASFTYESVYGKLFGPKQSNYGAHATACGVHSALASSRA